MPHHRHPIAHVGLFMFNSLRVYVWLQTLRETWQSDAIQALQKVHELRTKTSKSRKSYASNKGNEDGKTLFVKRHGCLVFTHERNTFIFICLRQGLHIRHYAKATNNTPSDKWLFNHCVWLRTCNNVCRSTSLYFHWWYNEHNEYQENNMKKEKL